MSMPLKLTKKAYEEFLNERDGVTLARWGNGRYGANKRPYGTYLRNQDPEMFTIEYEKWRTTQLPSDTGEMSA